MLCTQKALFICIAQHITDTHARTYARVGRAATKNQGLAKDYEKEGGENAAER